MDGGLKVDGYEYVSGQWLGVNGTGEWSVKETGHFDQWSYTLAKASIADKVSTTFLSGNFEVLIVWLLTVPFQDSTNPIKTEILIFTLIFFLLIFIIKGMI